MALREDLEFIRAVEAGDGHAEARGALAEAARLAGVAPPPLYAVDTPLPNAFVLRREAAGVTRGLLDLLSAEELRAVFLTLLLRTDTARLSADADDLRRAAARAADADLRAARLLPDALPLVTALQKVLARDHCLWWADLGAGAYLADESPFVPRPRMPQRVAALRSALGVPADAAPPPEPQPPATAETARAFLARVDPVAIAPDRPFVYVPKLPKGMDVRVYTDAVALFNRQSTSFVVPEVVDRLGGEAVDVFADAVSAATGYEVRQPAHEIPQQERADVLARRARRRGGYAGLVIVSCVVTFVALGITALSRPASAGAVLPAAVFLTVWWAIVILPRAIPALAARVRLASRSPVPGAVAASPAQLPMTSRALDDMSLAAGIARPRLYLLDSEIVNAFVIGRESPAVGVTSALARTLTLDEQRAVLAVLLARATAVEPPSAEEVSSPLPPAVEAADLAATRLTGDPEAVLSALTRVFASAYAPTVARSLGAWGWFCFDAPMDAAVRLGEHPRIRRLRQVLGAEGLRKPTA